MNRTNHLQPGLDMGRRYPELARLEARLAGWLARYSVNVLRVSLGLVFLGFGALKFVPGLSPVEPLAEQTVETLTLGLFPGGVGIGLVALLETAIGLLLVTGRYLRLGLVLLGVTMVGILAPLVLFPDELFGRRFFAPTLEAQYVLKDVVLLAAGLVIAAAVLGQRPTVGGPEPRRLR